MAPLRQPVEKEEKYGRVREILDFAQRLLALLRERSPVGEDIQPALASNIRRLNALAAGSAASILAATASEFDAAGTELWNGTTNILRDAEEHQRDPRPRRDIPSRVTVLIRVFAFHMLDAAYRASSKRGKNIAQCTRNFKLALKSCRMCLEQNELEPAIKILERCADFVEAIEGASPLVRLTDESGSDNSEMRMKSLTIEFCLLRIMHAWKSARLDLATHFVKQLNSASACASGGLAEKAADLFYEIGNSRLKASDAALAIEWLERALTILDACDVEQLSGDAADLRLSISAKLVRCLSSSQDNGARARATSIVEQLTEDPNLGNRLAVHVMQLDWLLADAPVRMERVQSVVTRMMRSSVLNDQTFKLIIQAIHRVKKRSAQAARDLLNNLIHHRLIPITRTGDETDEADRSRLEKACVTFVLFAVDEADIPPTLEAFLNTISQEHTVTMSAKAVHAMQALIWKASGIADPSTAPDWLQVLRHPAFDSAGLVNKATIGRKAITLAIEQNDLDGAREAYFRMPPAVQQENLTQYLLFKLAIRCNDYSLACESLDQIAKHTRDDGKFLYACVLEVQESNMRQIAVAAFGALLDKQPPGVHLPTLLRCTVRLMAAELDSPDSEQVANVDEMVQVFEKAAANVKALKQGMGEQWRAEMQWWSKNAYNLSLRLCGKAPPELLCRLLATCLTFIDNYPIDSGVTQNDDLKQRKILCHFLAASAMVVMARSGEDRSEYSLQCYLSCRQQVQSFRSILDPATADADAPRRLFELLKYDVECILRLQQWDQLNSALQACLDCKSVDRWDTLADLVLIIHSQSNTIGLEERDNVQMISLIQRIINETWKKDKDLVKVSRWLRLSFSIDLSDGDGTFALKLLHQAADMAQKGYEGSSDQVYPEAELQWLSTTAFNKAVDFLSGGEYDSSKEWIDGALELARYAADQGALHANLTYKKSIAMERIKAAGRI